MKSDLNKGFIYILFGLLVVGIIMSQIIDFIRGLVELALALGAVYAHGRSRSSMIKQVLKIVGVGLVILGAYDIINALW